MSPSCCWQELDDGDEGADSVDEQVLDNFGSGLWLENKIQKCVVVIHLPTNVSFMFIYQEF